MAYSVVSHGTWLLMFWALVGSTAAFSVISLTEAVNTHWVHTGLFIIFYGSISFLLFVPLVLTSGCLLDSIAHSESERTRGRKNGEKSNRYKHSSHMFSTAQLIAEWRGWVYLFFITWAVLLATYITFWSWYGFNPSFALGDPVTSAGRRALNWASLQKVAGVLNFFLAAIGLRNLVTISQVIYGDMKEVEYMNEIPSDQAPQEMMAES